MNLDPVNSVGILPVYIPWQLQWKIFQGTVNKEVEIAGDVGEAVLESEAVQEFAGELGKGVGYGIAGVMVVGAVAFLGYTAFQYLGKNLAGVAIKQTLNRS